jgi:Ras homolog enriched in brain
VHGYILVFSVVSRQSFDMIHHVNDLLFNTLGDAPDVPRVLVGCMKDLATQRQVNQIVRNRRCLHYTLHICHSDLTLTEENAWFWKEAQNLADSWKIPYIECSSKTGENVAEIFHTLMKEIEKDDGLLTEKSETGCQICWRVDHHPTCLEESNALSFVAQQVK